MMIIGVDYHPSFQAIAFLMEETGECGEQELNHSVGHEVIVAHARKVRLIVKSRRKDDRLDARTLARLARIDPELLSPVQHRSAQAPNYT